MHACRLMEDVRQRLDGMGLSGLSSVTMEQLSDVEWKLGEMKVSLVYKQVLGGWVYRKLDSEEGFSR